MFKKLLICLSLGLPVSGLALEKSYLKTIEPHNFAEAGGRYLYPDEVAWGLGFNYGKWLNFWAQHEDGLTFDARAKVFQGHYLPSVVVGANQYKKHGVDDMRSEAYLSLLSEFKYAHLGAAAILAQNPFDVKYGIGGGLKYDDLIAVNFESVYENQEFLNQGNLELMGKNLAVSMGMSYQRGAHNVDPWGFFGGVSLRMPWGGDHDEEPKSSASEKPLSFAAEAELDKLDWESKLIDLEKRVAALEAQKNSSQGSFVAPTQIQSTEDQNLPKVEDWNLDELRSLERASLEALENPSKLQDFWSNPLAADFVGHLLLSPLVSEGLRSAAISLSEKADNPQVSKYLEACARFGANEKLAKECRRLAPQVSDLWSPKISRTVPLEKLFVNTALSLNGNPSQSAIERLNSEPGLLQNLVHSPYTAPSVRQAAARMRSLANDPARVDDLRKWLEDRDPKVRGEAVKGLGNALDLASAKKIKEMAWQDPSDEVQAEAKKSLGHLVGELSSGLSSQPKADSHKESHANPKSKESKKHSAKVSLPKERKLPKSETYPSGHSPKKHQSPKFEPITGHELEDAKPGPASAPAKDDHGGH